MHIDFDIAYRIFCNLETLNTKERCLMIDGLIALCHFILFYHCFSIRFCTSRRVSYSFTITTRIWSYKPVSRCKGIDFWKPFTCTCKTLSFSFTGRFSGTAAQLVSVEPLSTKLDDSNIQPFYIRQRHLPTNHHAQ